ncbi:MAG: ankyrin repeat domain-containing protein [Gammaproteobacteria bacterium]|nr:ankyrin repeat domain-containing protein [Gammaproteobacteria bacterium]
MSYDTAETQLHQAAKNGDLERAQQCLRTVDINKASALNGAGDSVLHSALSYPKTDTVENKKAIFRLFMETASATLFVHQNAAGKTILHKNALNDLMAELVDEILNQAPELASTKDSNGTYPIHVAVSSGQIAIVKQLFAHDQHPKALCDANGNSPLHLAVALGNAAMVAACIAGDPDTINTTNRNGETPLYFAKDPNIRDYLIANDADPALAHQSLDTQTDRNMTTPSPW